MLGAKREVLAPSVNSPFKTTERNKMALPERAVHVMYNIIALPEWGHDRVPSELIPIIDPPGIHHCVYGKTKFSDKTRAIQICKFSSGIILAKKADPCFRSFA